MTPEPGLSIRNKCEHRLCIKQTKSHCIIDIWLKTLAVVFIHCLYAKSNWNGVCVFKVQQKVALIQQVFDRRMDIEIHYGNPELFKFKANLISKLKLNWSKQLIFSPKKRLDVLVASRLVIYFIYHGCVSCSPYQKSKDHRCIYCCLALAYSVVFDGCITMTS